MMKSTQNASKAVPLPITLGSCQTGTIERLMNSTILLMAARNAMTRTRMRNSSKLINLFLDRRPKKSLKGYINLKIGSATEH